MLEAVDIGTQHVGCYEDAAGGEVVARLEELAGPLRGARVLHLNATPYGGGVAEILRSEVPLLRDLGLDADWKIITGDEKFFSVTKKLHNALQGAEQELSAQERETYITHSVRNAHLLEERYDLIVVHDPQPLALPHFYGGDGTRWLWRCHIDTSEPNPRVWGFLEPYLSEYDAAAFTLEGFVPPGFPVERVEIIPPAIDPESPKNLELRPATARRVLQWIGVEVERPLITQVSRFDPWKDPLGVIEAYRLVREEFPESQLALVGSMALDDPEGWEIYHNIQEAAREDEGVHVFTNLTGVGNIEVNAFQRYSDVVIQKSIREGFGLVVSETLWKETPVVAGRAGGIPLQVEDGVSGYLVDSVEECAGRVIELLRQPGKGREMGVRGREAVREKFLLPRLISDELRLYAELLGVSLKAV
ncbi:glycosyltransferase [Rubrobacter taiwanensis]|jgi:trehalose synthase|uniref:Glycosyltransferase n=1 Tax=Rubrobacter taiwanensis TaxID=185139 RepID=A0A4V2NX64_9ACTN|nr:glycosyltransferase [Rubrobacter taiwanensis]TCJ20042.1 glycosyltransferase [Rubrobacter taiwanensis]